MDVYRKRRSDDESSLLLPRLQHVSNYDATPTEAGRGGQYCHHHRYHRADPPESVQPNPFFRRAAALIVICIAVAVICSTAVESYNHRNAQSTALNDVEDGMVSPDEEGGGGKSEPAAGVGGGVDSPPNVIFILVDDLGMNDLGSTSTDIAVATPFIDSLADDGVRIIRYYTNHICTPARASLMTGRDSFRTGMQFEELTNFMPWAVPLEEATLADRFKYAGYNTHMVGKWNLGMYTENHYPFNRGFDTFLGYLGPQESYYGHDKSFMVGTQSLEFSDFGYGDKDGYMDYTTNTTRQGPHYKGVYSTTLFGDRAITIAEEHMAENEAAGTDDPLFMYLAFQAAHSPLDVPENDMFTTEQLEVLDSISVKEPVRLDFAKIVYYMDITVERVFNALDDMGMMDNTLVVIASDNGGCPSGGGSNFPFRGFKRTLFEGGVRTPALVYSKDSSIIPAEARGTSYDGMMHAIDWTPTLANVTGIPTDEIGMPLSGYDMWSAIIGEAPETVRNELVLGRNSYVHDGESSSMIKSGQPRGAYINNGWKINIGDKCAGWFSFNPDDDISSDAKCNVGECPTCTQECRYEDADQNDFLFHLDEDPYELNNLVNAMPDKFNDMVRLWNEATVHEVKSNYEAYDSDSVEMWQKYHHWEIAWL